MVVYMSKKPQKGSWAPISFEAQAKRFASTTLAQPCEGFCGRTTVSETGFCSYCRGEIAFEVVQVLDGLNK